MSNVFYFPKRMLITTRRTSLIVAMFLTHALSFAQADTSHQPLPFLEDNPIWIYKYEHMAIPQIMDPEDRYWYDAGERRFSYYFLGRQKEIEGKVYTMIGEVTSHGEDGLTVGSWLPVREENGIVYAFTDSLPGIIDPDKNYYDIGEIPYLQQGKECVLYNFCAETGEVLYPGNAHTVLSYDTCQLLDGTECRVLKTEWASLCEKIGFIGDDLPAGIVDPLLPMIVPTNGHVYASRLNAYYQDGRLLYKAPDAPEGICVNGTCWTREDASEYAVSYKKDPRQEEVFSYIQSLRDQATDIDKVQATEAHDTYDLQGRKVSGKLPKGIYIEGGKKVLRNRAPKNT